MADAPSASAPYYADLSKKVNEVFSKGYHFGLMKLDLKSKGATVEFCTSTTISNQQTGKVVLGSFSSKHTVKDTGFTFTEKWNSDNTIIADATIQNQIAPGLKVVLEGTFVPAMGTTSGKLKTLFANESVAVNANLGLCAIDAAAVFKYQGLLAGVLAQFDISKCELTKNNVAVGYQSNEFNLLVNVNNGKEFGGSIYQKISEKVECGISLKWISGSENSQIGVGGRFMIDAESSLYTKANSQGLIGIGFQRKLLPGIVLTLSAAFDGQALTGGTTGGGHKVGAALEVETAEGAAE